MSTGVIAETDEGVDRSARAVRVAHAAAARAARSPAVWVAVTTVALYLLAARERWNRLQYGLDLGIFTEAVRHYAHGEWPWSMVKSRGGFNLLGDHFSPAMALFAVPYRIVPDARTIVAVQAALVGVTAGLVTRAGCRVAGRRLGVGFGLAYAFAYGTSAMAMFDVHEVALALPLLALAGIAWTQRRWWAVVGWAAPLMLVKEDSVFLLLGFALVLAVAWAWRQAAVLAGFGLASFAFVITVAIPRLSWSGTWTYWSAAPGRRGSLLAPLSTLAESLSTSGLPLAAALLAPTLGLALRSPLAVAALPPLLVRLTSPDPVYWGLHFHYNATVTVVLSVAGIDGWRRWRAAHPDVAVRPVARVAVAGLLVSATAVAACGPWGRTLRQWGRPDDVALVRAYLDGWGPGDGGDSIAADRRFLPYLADSFSVHELRPGLVDTNGQRIFPHRVLAECSVLDDDQPPGRADAARRPAALAGLGSAYTEEGFWAAGSPRRCVATLWVATGTFSPG